MLLDRSLAELTWFDSLHSSISIDQPYRRPYFIHPILPLGGEAKAVPKKGLVVRLASTILFPHRRGTAAVNVQVPPDWRQCFLINLKISIPKSDPRWEPASVNCWGLRSSPSGPSQERPSQRSSRAGASPSLPFRTSSWCHLHPMSETAQT